MTRTKRDKCGHPLVSLRHGITGIGCVDCGSKWDGSGAATDVILSSVQREHTRTCARIAAQDQLFLEMGYVPCDRPECGAWGKSGNSTGSWFKIRGRHLCPSCVVTALDDEDDPAFGSDTNAEEKVWITALARWSYRQGKARTPIARRVPQLVHFWRTLARADGNVAVEFLAMSDLEWVNWWRHNPGEAREILTSFGLSDVADALMGPVGVAGGAR